MANIPGFDAGISLRASWSSHTYTFNPWLGSTWSFNESYESRHYQMATGLQTSYDAYTRSGNLDFGYARYDLKIGARNQTLLPNLDLIANLGGILNPYTNQYNYRYERTINTEAINPNTFIYGKTSEDGIEPGAGIYPGTGLGGLLELRSDYHFSDKITFIGEFALELLSRSVADDTNQERSDTSAMHFLSGPDLYSNETTTHEKDEYSGTISNTQLNGKIRALYQAQGWRIGLGASAATNASVSEITTTTSYLRTITASGRPVAADNSNTVTTSGSATEATTRSVTDTFTIPVGLQIDLLDNLPIYFGASHIITVSENTTQSKVTNRTRETTTMTDGTGATSSVSSDVTNAKDALTTSEVSQNHTTQFFFGLTWWPKENLQIDAKNIFRWDDWRDFEISFTFHF